MGQSTTDTALEGELLPLSLSQREVWLDQMAWPQSCHLNIGGCCLLVGALDPGRLQAALRLLVAETEALRLVPLRSGRQRLLPVFEPVLESLDFSAMPDPEQAIRQWWQDRMQVPFALGEAPPWRFALLKGGEDLHGLTTQFHHLVMDGWGTTQIYQRWSELYNALSDDGQGMRAALRDTGAPGYRSFIDESLAYHHSAAFERDAEYWMTQVAELPAPLIERRHALPKGIDLPPAHTVACRLPRTQYEQLARFCAGRSLTPFTVLLTALALYFARTRMQSWLVVGVPNLNRGGRRFLQTPGMFVGVFPLAITVDPGASVAALMEQVNGRIRSALRHPRYPLSELLRSLQAIRGHRDSLFDVLLSFERQDYSVSFGAARLCDPRQLFSGTARYPLGVTVCEFHREQDPELVLEGSSACFEATEVELLGRRLWHLVMTMIASPARQVAEVDLLPIEERQALLEGLHRNLARLDQPQPFISQFEQHAALRPEAVALVWDDGSMDYGELQQRARRLALRLQQAGAGRGSIVALALERSPETVLAMLAVALLGAAFLPLDVDAPPGRLQDILGDSGAAMLLIQDRNRTRLAHLHHHALVIDEADAASGPLLPAQAGLPAPTDLAYVLFTSGSTGRPKGVMVDHAALSRRLAWLSTAFAVSAEDRSAQATQSTFDPALIELCLPLIHGASIALPPAGRLASASLLDFVVRQRVTLMAFVPSTLQRFVDELALQPAARAGLRLRAACSGGEVLSAELSNRFLRETGARLYNVYGPTEACIFATAWPCEIRDTGEPLPVGRAIDDTRIYVLDAALQPMPFGETGEIWIGGEGLARGYLHRPDLDRQVFVPDPFCPGQRIYRSGDLGWLGCDGNLHFLGRRDRQIKLRGYRIELGEIEAALGAISGVRRAAVKLVDVDGRPTLHAWVAALTGVDAATLHLHLRGRLPDYMLPNGISVLDRLPETSTGKIDLGALPLPATQTGPVFVRKPSDRLEQDLLSLWEEVLQKKPLGVTDDFFEVGGDSLAAIDILSGIEKRFGRKLPLHLLTEHPTVEGLARVLGEHSAPAPLVLRLGAESGRPPLYLAASGHGDLLRFQALARELGSTFELYMLQPPGEDAGSMVDLAERYADWITAHPARPGYLAGFSIGGVAALETARALQRRGIEPAGLVLIDTIYPRALLRANRLWRLSGKLTKWLHVQELSMNGRRLGAMFSDPGLGAQINALGRYQPAPYVGRALLIKSSGLLNWERWLFLPWRHLLGQKLEECVTPGLHGSLFESDNVTLLAAALKSMLSNRAGEGARNEDD